MDAKFGRPIPGLYGIGQGYSLPTNDPSVQAESRYGAKADSVGLYIKQIGNKILSQVIPQKKIKFVVPMSPPDLCIASSVDLGFKLNNRANTTTCPKTQEHRSEKFRDIPIHNTP